MARGNERRRYDYQPPSYDETVTRAERKGSMYDAMFKDVKLYTAVQGVNSLRILPPTWEGARHYGLPIFVHRNVGPNDRTYLCLRENDSSPHKHCPPCDELFELGSRATKQDKDDLRAGISMAFYVIDRAHEEEGVQVWLTSMRNDSEIAAQSINRRNKSVLNIVDPDEGYDIEFSRHGTGLKNTTYRGFQVMREWSPLHDNEKQMDRWLDEIAEHPLTERLQYFSPEHILKAMTGRAKDDNEDDDRRTRSRDDDDEDRRDRRSGRSRDDDDEDGRPSQRRRPDDDDDRSSRDDTRDDRRRSRDDDDDRRSRSRGRDDDEDRGRDRDPEPSQRRSRTRTEEELDDEIPSDAGRRRRPNGRDADGDDDTRSSRRSRSREDNGEADEGRNRTRDRGNSEAAQEPPRQRRARQSLDDDGDNGGGDDDRRAPDDDAEARRERMRERLRR